MTRLQIGVIGAAVALLFIIYFGCDTKPEEQEALEKSRALAVESTNLEALLLTAKEELTPAQSSEILVLEQQLEAAANDTAKVETLKQLSSKWYEFRQPAIAGAYAQQIAETENTEEAWSIAGTTYAICIQLSEEQKVREFCSDRAIAAFESAISINPDNITHRVNLALTYAENPPADNPMRGPSMLLELNQAYPNNVLILNSLARLAIKTGQYDRALERLEQAYTQDSQNVNTICMLAQVHNALGNGEEATEFARQCETARNQ